MVLQQQQNKYKKTILFQDQKRMQIQKQVLNSIYNEFKKAEDDYLPQSCCNKKVQEKCRMFFISNCMASKMAKQKLVWAITVLKL